MMIELRGGIKVQSASNNVKRGERAVLAVRPEAFIILRQTTKNKNTIQGMIERVTFEGTNIRYEIILENEDKIVIVKPSMSEEWFKLNEKVTVSFPSDKTHVFPYPEGGLREELAVE
jgi:ABC-type Fe3+/spermidine/putrescine transport system ATPase subunit